MRKSLQFLIILGSVLAVIVVADFTLSNNQSAGVYPIDADSIGIPLVETLFIAANLMVLFLIAFVLTTFVKRYQQFAKWAGMFFYLVGAALAIIAGMSWFIPHHYSILISYLLVGGVGLSFAIIAYAKNNL